MKLDPKDVNDYHIVTALRGPDNETAGSDAAKDMTTAVLRWFVGISDAVGAIVYSPISARAMWELMPSEHKTETRDFMRMNSHFRSHTHAAFRHLIFRLKQNKAPKATREQATNYFDFLYKEDLL